MSLALYISLIVGLLVVAAAGIALAAASIALSDWRGPPVTVACGLRWIALTATVVIAIWLVPSVWDDSGAFTIALVGIPIGAGLLAVGADIMDRATPSVTWVAELVMLAWSLVTSLGAGFEFLAPSLLMLSAAAVSRPRRRDRGAAPTPTGTS